jgi:hypothetical protein
MTGIAYILGRIKFAWLDAPPLIVLIVLGYDVYLFCQPANAASVIIAALLFYFMVETYPRRWVLDIIILLVGISLISDGLQQAQITLRSLTHHV